MPRVNRNESTTPAVPTVAPEGLTDELRAILADVQAHAAACGRLDCGHLYRGPSQAVREAVILYTAEGMGMVLNLNNVRASVAAVVGVLRTSNHARPTYTRGRTANGGTGNRQHANGVTLIMPNPWGIKMTPQRIAVFSSLLKGVSIVQTGVDQNRTTETVKSHAGYLRRETQAHDAVSALLCLVAARRLAHRAIAVPDEVFIAPPVAVDDAPTDTPAPVQEGDTEAASE